MHNKLKIYFISVSYFLFAPLVFVSSSYSMSETCDEDITDTGHPRPLKVLPFLETALTVYESRSYTDAFNQFNVILNLLRSYRDETNRDIDVSGKIKKGFIETAQGFAEEVFHYNSESPLIDGIAHIYSLASDCAEKNGNFNVAAEYYELSGDCYSDQESNLGALSQLMYLNAAENFDRATLYEESFNLAEKAATCAIEFYPKRKEFICLTVAIQMFCNNMKDKLNGTNKTLSNNFYELAENLTPYFSMPSFKSSKPN